jgi:predicted phage-related endonuclease
MTAAEQVTEVDLTPGSSAWGRLVSGSKVAAMLGVSPWSSPLATWLEMKGQVPRDGDGGTEAKRRGHFLEPAILAWWRDRHPNLLSYEEQPTNWFEDWGIATLDALAMTEDYEWVIAEAKSTSSWDGWGKEGTDEVPLYYLAQVLWQMACTPQAERAYVAAIGPFLDFREYVIERDDEKIEDLVRKVRAFKESLEGDDPPELDGHPATLKAVSRLHLGVVKKEVATIPDADAREYVEAEAALEAAQERQRTIKSKLLQASGKAQYIDSESGVRVARRQQKQDYAPFLVQVAKTWPSVESCAVS